MREGLQANRGAENPSHLERGSSPLTLVLVRGTVVSELEEAQGLVRATRDRNERAHLVLFRPLEVVNLDLDIRDTFELLLGSLAEAAQ